MSAKCLCLVDLVGRVSRLAGAKILCLSAFVLVVAVSGCRTYSPQPGESCSFEFPFMSDYNVINRTNFDWSDAYVTNNPFAYHQEIAGPLSALAASTYGYRHGMDIRSLESLGFEFERITRCYGEGDFYRHPKYGRDRVGHTIASRRCGVPGVGDIVMVLCRGTFGREEWRSNINVANEWSQNPELPEETMPQFHEGFSKAADSVMASLAEHVAEHKIDLSKAKIFVAGHSRGAAVANLVGSRLDQAAAGAKTAPFAGVKAENVFVYTIATPNVTIRPTPDAGDPMYGNIFNVVSPEDIVPLVPFQDWDGARYGHTLLLKTFDNLPLTGSWTNRGYCDMKDHFKDICGYKYFHMFLGTNITARIPGWSAKIAPTIADFYWIHPDLREDGDRTSVHSFLDMVICKRLPKAEEQDRKDVTLSGDFRNLTAEYERIAHHEVMKKMQRLAEDRFRREGPPDPDSFNPNGRNFSRQPRLTDFLWKLTCMHATQTYVAWMKSASENGPDEIFINWEEECGSDE